MSKGFSGLPTFAKKEHSKIGVIFVEKGVSEKAIKSITSRHNTFNIKVGNEIGTKDYCTIETILSNGVNVLVECDMIFDNENMLDFCETFESHKFDIRFIKSK